jgi:hypothetical protein
MVSPQVFRNLRQTSCTDAHLMAASSDTATTAGAAACRDFTLSLCKTCLLSAEAREPMDHARRTTIRRFLASPRSADLFTRRILGNICRLHLSTRVSVGSCRVERSPAGDTSRSFYRRMSQVEVSWDIADLRRGPGWIAVDLARMKLHEPLRRY